MRNLSLFRAALAALLLILSHSSLADALRWYEVEVVAFAHARGEYLNSETWPTEWQQPDTEQAIDFVSITDEQFSSLPASGALEGTARTIDKSSRYRLLAYQRWRQAGLPSGQTKAVRFGNQTYLTSSVPAGEDVLGNPITQVVELPELDGTISIELRRFLHIYTDLLYYAPIEQVPLASPTNTISPAAAEPVAEPAAEPVTEQAARLAKEATAQTRLQGFRLQAHRKTRSKTTQFIDHPMFGLIVRITPVETL